MQLVVEMAVRNAVSAATSLRFKIGRFLGALIAPKRSPNKLFCKKSLKCLVVREKIATFAPAKPKR